MGTPGPALAGQSEAPSGPRWHSRLPPPPASQGTRAVSADGAPRQHPTWRRAVGLEGGRAAQLHLRPAGVSAPLNPDASTWDTGCCARGSAGLTRGPCSPAANPRSSAGHVIAGDVVQVFVLCLAQCPALCEREPDWGAEDWLPSWVLVALVTLPLPPCPPTGLLL